MKNRDMPAMPYSGDIDNCSLTIEEAWGLTKREHFAGLAMQSLSNSLFTGCENDIKQVAKVSVMVADALLAALEKENGL